VCRSLLRRLRHREVNEQTFLPRDHRVQENGEVFQSEIELKQDGRCQTLSFDLGRRLRVKKRQRGRSAQARTELDEIRDESQLHLVITHLHELLVILVHDAFYGHNSGTSADLP
jgi:hypothetical protein